MAGGRWPRVQGPGRFVDASLSVDLWGDLSDWNKSSSLFWKKVVSHEWLINNVEAVTVVEFRLCVKARSAAVEVGSRSRKVWPRYLPLQHESRTVKCDGNTARSTVPIDRHAWQDGSNGFC